VSDTYDQQLLPLPEESSVQDDECKTQRGSQARERNQDEIDGELIRIEFAEARLKCDSQQEAPNDLRAGLGDTSFLQNFVPVAVRSLKRSLLSAVFVDLYGSVVVA